MSVTEKPLKYVEYPDDLPNERFLVPQIDTAEGGMGTPGTVPESAATKAAFDALKEDLSHKANSDGSYDTLTAGNAKQILSNLEQTDMVPYNYRTAGGSLEIGDREKLKKIVGVSLPVNQQAKVFNAQNWYDENGVTSSYENGVATIASETAGNGILSNYYPAIHKDHVYFESIDAKCSTTINLQFGPSVARAVQYINSPTFTNVAQIKKASADSTIKLAVFGSGATYSDLTVKNMLLIDLTAMFGSTIADYVYGLETATAGAGVAWLKSHFPKIFDAGYIPYNAGTLEHVSGLSEHKTVGFNQWDEEWKNGRININTGAETTGNGVLSKNMIPVIPSTVYHGHRGSYVGASGIVVCYYDANGSYLLYENKVGSDVDFTTPANCHFIKFNIQTSAEVTTYNHDICINLHWDGERDGEYEPYEEHSYPLDSDVTLRGIPKLDANNNLYYDGDEYVADGTVARRYGIVDLGTLSWGYTTSYARGVFYADLSGRKKYTGLTYPNFSTPLYVADNSGSPSGLANHGNMKIAATDNSTQILITNDSYSDKTSFKSAMSGVYLVYELAEPTTETADPYTEIQNVSNWGTEEFVTTSLVPVGHETAYQPDLRAKIEVAPESPDVDGLYLMKRENGQNSYVAYLGELPSDPTTDGTYTLKCTVSGGTATKTWEADT